MDIRPHDRFCREVQLEAGQVSAQARALGDDNPLHHDPTFAAGTRFGRLLASGTQTTGLLLGLTASHFSQGCSMLGLDYWVGFRRPIHADERIRLEWLVIRVTPHERLGGRLVELRGRILGEDGRTAVGARGRLLVTEQL